MTLITTDSQHYTDIASAIRLKTGVQDLFKPSQMASAIAAIPTGGGASLGSKSITANGTYYASADSLDGYSQVTVNVPSGGFSFEAPIGTDITGGFVGSGNWTNDGNTNSLTDVYLMQDGHKYIVILGATVGNRLRVAALPSSPIDAQANITGTRIGTDQSDPSAYSFCNSVASATSPALYLAIGKTNQSQAGINTYVLDITNL